MKPEVKITIHAGNKIEFLLEPSGMPAVAQLMEFDSEHGENLDVVSYDGWRGKHPARIKLPEIGREVWVVTTGFHGCFWAYDLRHIMDYLQKKAAEFELVEGME